MTIVANAAPDADHIQIQTTDGTFIDVSRDEDGTVHVYIKDKHGTIWDEILGEYNENF